MYPVGGGARNNNEILEQENGRLRQLVESLQSELARVKRLVLSDNEKTKVILNQEMEIKRLRLLLDERDRQIYVMERSMARGETEIDDYKRRELEWAMRHRRDGRKSVELEQQNKALARLAGNKMERDEIREGVEVLTGLRNSPSPSPPKIGVAPKDPFEEAIANDPGLREVDEEWQRDDAKPYINPEDRKKIRAGVVAAGPVQAQSPKKPEKKGRPAKRKPSKKLNLEEPKRQEIELDTKYGVGDDVEVVLYKWNTNLDEDTLMTWDATVVKTPNIKDTNYRGIPVPAGHYAVQFQARRESVAPALGSFPSGLKRGESVYVIKGKFTPGYGTVKLEKKLSEKIEQSLRF